MPVRREGLQLWRRSLAAAGDFLEGHALIVFQLFGATRRQDVRWLHSQDGCATLKQKPRTTASANRERRIPMPLIHKCDPEIGKENPKTEKLFAQPSMIAPLQLDQN